VSAHPLRVGIVGAGFMGRVHAEAFRELPGVEIVGFLSRQREHAAALAARFGGRAYESEQELIQDPDLDVVDVTYPTHRHPDLTEAAFAAGKHVICEKPIAFSLDDADRMLTAAERADRLLCIAHCVRFWPGYIELQQMVASGAFGRPLTANARRMLPRPQTRMWQGGDALTGGAVIDLMIHDFDYLNWLFGTPRSVSALGHSSADGRINHIFASVRYEGAEALAEGSLLLPRSFPFTSGVRVVCERGALEYLTVASGGQADEPPRVNTLTVYPAEGEAYEAPLDPRSAYLIQADYFVRCLREGRPPQIGSGAQAREALRLSLAAREALQQGREVAV
jgi:predicted dehydrogenase